MRNLESAIRLVAHSYQVPLQLVANDLSYQPYVDIALPDTTAPPVRIYERRNGFFQASHWMNRAFPSSVNRTSGSNLHADAYGCAMYDALMELSWAFRIARFAMVQQGALDKAIRRFLALQSARLAPAVEQLPYDTFAPWPLDMPAFERLKELRLRWSRTLQGYGETYFECATSYDKWTGTQEATLLARCRFEVNTYGYSLPETLEQAAAAYKNSEKLCADSPTAPKRRCSTYCIIT